MYDVFAWFLMNIKAKHLTILLAVSLLAVRLPAQTVGVSAPAHEPANLGKLKTLLESYHDCTCTCGCYTKSLDQQAQIALNFLNHRAAPPQKGKLALVLDIDDTSLSTYPEMISEDFGFNSDRWATWARTSSAPAISGTLRLYQRARELGVAVFFITGRLDTLRGATEANLRNAGYEQWDGLTMRTQAQANEKTIPYKSDARAAIVAQGYTMILNVGDQWSDLRGKPTAQFSVKLPDPFYYIP
jgi:acid phosphatase